MLGGGCVSNELGRFRHSGEWRGWSSQGTERCCEGGQGAQRDGRLDCVLAVIESYPGLDVHTDE